MDEAEYEDYERDVYETMERYLNDKTEPEAPEDVDFEPYSVGYMFQTGNNFVQFGIFPDAGGWNDQDAAWTDALQKWLALRNYLSHERKSGSDKPLDEMFGSTSASEWGDFMKG